MKILCRLLCILTVVILIASAALAVALAFPNAIKKLAAGSPLEQLLPPLLPKLKVVRSAYWLEQNWSTEDRFWFHHASQGTATFPVPYDWFVALEQPDLSLSPGLMKDPDYLVRFGFIPSPRTLASNPTELARYGFTGDNGTQIATPLLARTPAENPDGLPVGFARTVGTIDPVTGAQQPDQLGLTCAACHTGHIEYHGVSLRFDGGPAMVNLQKLTQAVGLSIAYTLKLPWRFEAFANRVLGAQSADPAKRAALKAKLTSILEDTFRLTIIHNSAARGEAARHGVKEETEEGFGRLDALNRIGNQVFYTDMTDDDGKLFKGNIAAQLAPVSFPPIWTVPWLSWAQYDASIGQPLVRNAGEALGVSAIINLNSPGNKFHPLFSSSVAVNNLYVIENLLKGESPFKTEPHAFHGLLAPKWPSAYFQNDPKWKLDPDKVARGRVLYRELCAECHLGPISDPVFDHKYPEASFWTSKQWHAVEGSDEKILEPIQLRAEAIQTDPQQSKILQTRQVEVLGGLKLDPIAELKEKWGCSGVNTPASAKLPYSLALMIVVDRANQQWFKAHSVSDDVQKQIIGNRKNCPNPTPGYKARPLDGVWATAPYLHNGSVPSLWWLLKPAHDRPKAFCLGASDFDPTLVGYDAPEGGVQSCPDGETMFRAISNGAPIIGNSTLGHSFEGKGDTSKAGIIGRGLNDPERYDLIEYLKTL